MWGADVAALEALGQHFHSKADELENTARQVTVQAAHAGWMGADAQQFQQVWQGDHRARLIAIAGELRTTGDKLRQQAEDQQRASGGGAAGVGGRPGVGGIWGPSAPTGRWGDATTANDLLTLGGGLFGTLGDARNLDWARNGGHAFQAAGYFVDGYAIGDDLGNGRYGDAALGGLFTAGDLTADVLKTKGPHGYLGGVAVQAWTQAGRAAQDVDWSPQGLQAITDASAGEWVDALGYSLTQMPTQLVKIFSL